MNVPAPVNGEGVNNRSVLNGGVRARSRPPGSENSTHTTAAAAPTSLQSLRAVSSGN